MKKLLLLSTFLISFQCFSQFSKTHYIPPISFSPNQNIEEQAMYISCPSTTPVAFRITQLGSTIVLGTVSRDNPYVFDTSINSNLTANGSEISTVLSNKGYVVEADDLIYVTVRVKGGGGNQAGGLVSKGLAALGTKYRIGAFTNTGYSASAYNAAHQTFASILATENNTTISFGDIKTGVVLVNNAAAGNSPASIVLNRGQSYVFAAQGPTNSNRDGLIGASITSDKPIAVNCGSIGGSNGDASNNMDYGFDQIVSAERTGKEYIFIKGNGVSVTERPIIVANVNNTQIFLNGSTTPNTTLNAGQYIAYSGTDFSANGNLYIRTSENVFAYQGIGGNTSQANQNLHFLPPLSCETPKVINNIPLINSVAGDSNFTGTVCLVTETGATLNFIINGNNYTINNLPGTVSGPFAVNGNLNFVTYRINGLTGNVSVFSSKQVYLSYFAFSGNATYGGFYSGFTFKPELSLSPISIAASNCIPNVKLAVNSLSSFDFFQWYQNGILIPGATLNEYQPTTPGFYSVEAKISTCPSVASLFSDNIPVSACPADIDNDNIPDNIDLDNDNDGITNCNESLGNKVIDLSVTAGTVAISPYSNPYTTVASTTGSAVATPYVGSTDGSFVTEVFAGKTNSVSRTINFSAPISIMMEYPSTAAASDLINNNGEYMLQVAVNKTITVLNPNDQLLIDTNYDGIFESGITSFSSFQIRFRLNSTSLAAGSGTFRFFSNQVDSILFTHKNLTDSTNNKATFKFTATCLPKDSDGDGVADQNDRDADNDGIPDVIENLGQNYAVIPFVDINKNGLNDAYESITALDSDGDGVLNYLDYDSDNDGIFDLTESGNTGLDADNNGVLDGAPSAFGINGIFNALETAPDSNILNYAIANGDTDAFQNFIDLDSEADGCNDVTEVNYLDPNIDGILGNVPVTVDSNGLVTSATGYAVLNALQQTNYSTAAPIIITTQPANTDGCEAGNTTFSIITNGVTTHQWQVSTDGGLTFSNIGNVTPYSGANTSSLTIANAPTSLNDNQYRVFLTKIGNACNLMSNAATFTVLTRPAVASQITIVQCDTDLDLIADFNLTQKNDAISAQAASQTFTYFTSEAGAIADDASLKINTPTAFNSATGNTVWARIVNLSNGCFNFSRINLVVSATQLPAGFSRTFSVCDDFVDAANNDYDGISKFNFSSVENDVLGVLPTSTGFSINYYRTLADFNSESNPISKNIGDPESIYNYRNIGFVDNQTIYIRVESTLTNACYGDGKIFLIVEKLPVANAVSVTRQCDDNPADAVIEHAFDTTTILSTVLNGQSAANVDVTYFDAANNPIVGGLPNQLPNPFTSQTQQIRVRVTNKNGNDPTGKCFDETLIQFTVDKKPIANTVLIAAECDQIIDDGVFKYNFNTSNIDTTILGAQTATDFVITYFAQDGSPLSSPLPNPFFTATQQIKAVVTNPLNPTCTAQTFIQFTVNELPYIEPNDEDYFCDGTSGTKTINAGLIAGNQSDYDYQWFKDGTLLPGETNYSYDVVASGIYTTDVKDKVTGCFRTRTYKVIFSEKAKITNIVITDLYSEYNTVVVTVAGGGIYEFSIDEPSGPFQATGVFNNINSGIHTVYVNDKNGCDLAFQEIAIVGVMPFFTPNGDSFNDFWKIDGVTSKYNKKSEVFIYDRYGKLMKQIANGDDQGWDGTVNGQAVPADDYWFTLVMQDGRTLKGHFALKR